MADEMLTLRPSDALNLIGQDDAALGREHLSHTTLSLLLNCQRKYQFAKVDRLEPIEVKQSLQLGKAFHVGVEHDSPKVAAEYLMENAPEPRDQDEYDKQRISAHTVGAAVAAYRRTWGDKDAGEPEYGYRIRLRNPWTGHYSRSFDLLGYADRVIENDKNITLIENKFVGRLDETTIRKLKLDRQISLTCYGLWRATGKPVDVVDYRYVRKPSIRQKSGESVDDFIERLHADYESRPEFYLHAEALARDTRDLLAIEAELWAWADQLRHARHRHFFPRNTSHCSDYGGCQYLPLCLGDSDARSRYTVATVPPITPDEMETT